MAAAQDACGRLSNRARRAVRSLSAEDQASPNVVHFMSADFQDWFLCAAELTVACVEPAGPGGPPLSEPCHLDGGASVCHMSITLYGSRTLRCQQGVCKKGEAAALDGRTDACPPHVSGLAPRVAAAMVS